MTTALRNSVVLVCVLTISLSGSTLALIQGTVTGKVTDATGSAMANVDVQLIQNYECKCSDCQPVEPKPCARCCAPQRMTSTNDDGIYKFEGIPHGKYRLRVSAKGFATHETEVTVNGEKTTVDVKLALGDVKGVVKVSGCSFFCKFAKAVQRIF